MAITTLAPYSTNVPAANLYDNGTVLPVGSFVTSFPSKSEGTITLSQDGTGVTVSGYHVLTSANTPGPIGVLDVSNSSTSANTLANGVNTGGNSPRQANRAIAQFNLNTNATTTTDINAYSGNNARGVALINGTYYAVGNGNLAADIPGTNNGLNTGVQQVTPGNNAAPPVAGTAKATNGQQVGQFTIAQAGYNQGSDKVIKDNNFRGITEFTNPATIYPTPGNGLRADFHVLGDPALSGIMLGD